MAKGKFLSKGPFQLIKEEGRTELESSLCNHSFILDFFLQTTNKLMKPGIKLQQLLTPQRDDRTLHLLTEEYRTIYEEPLSKKVQLPPHHSHQRASTSQTRPTWAPETPEPIPMQTTGPSTAEELPLRLDGKKCCALGSGALFISLFPNIYCYFWKLSSP